MICISTMGQQKHCFEMVPKGVEFITSEDIIRETF